ncbi:MAG: hypothetical protein ACI8RZ_007868 [Myxococcota bacterium]|jgi:hypothetical protein
MLILPLLTACFDDDPKPNVAPAVLTIPEPPAPLTYTMKSVKKDTGDCDATCASFEASWPVFEGGGAEAINAWVLQAVGSSGMTGEPMASPEVAADRFLADWTDFRAEDPEAMGWSMERSVSVAFESDTLIVVGGSESSYTGGAHGNFGSSFGTFIRQTGQQVALSDILVDGYEAKLRPHIVAGLEVHFEASLAEVDLDHTAADIPLAGGWAITSESLTFHYDPYEIGPYVMGAPSAEIPKGKILDLIRKDSPW